MDYNHKFLVYSTEIGAEGVLATYDTYREAELYVISNSAKDQWSSLEIEPFDSPLIKETDYAKDLVLKLGWHVTGHYLKGELIVSFPQEVYVVVDKDCQRLPVNQIDDKSFRVTSFVSAEDAVEIIINLDKE